MGEKARSSRDKAHRQPRPRPPLPWPAPRHKAHPCGLMPGAPDHPAHQQCCARQRALCPGELRKGPANRMRDADRGPLHTSEHKAEHARVGPQAGGKARSLPAAAVTKPHSLSSLKQQKSLFSRVWRQNPKSRGQGFWGKTFPNCPRFSRPQAPLGCGSSPQSGLCRHMAALLIRTPATGLRARPISNVRGP